MRSPASGQSSFWSAQDELDGHGEDDAAENGIYSPKIETPFSPFSLIGKEGEMFFEFDEAFFFRGIQNTVFKELLDCVFPALYEQSCSICGWNKGRLLNFTNCLL